MSLVSLSVITILLVLWYNLIMTAGRPSKYKEEFIDKVDEYLDSCVDKVTTFHKTRSDNSNTYDRILKVTLPSHEGFAIYIGVNASTLYEWASKHEKFSKALENIMTAQKKVLLEKGTSGEYNSTIAKLVLSSNHGMSEKKEVDVTSEGKRIEGFTYISPDE